MFLYAFEESVDCHLLSSFCDDSNLHISLFKYLLSTMGASKESISKFLIRNRFHVKLRILSPSPYPYKDWGRTAKGNCYKNFWNCAKHVLYKTCWNCTKQNCWKVLPKLHNFYFFMAMTPGFHREDFGVGAESYQWISEQTVEPF